MHKFDYFEESERKCTCFNCKKIIQKNYYRAVRRVEDIVGSFVYSKTRYLCIDCFIKYIKNEQKIINNSVNKVLKEYQIILKSNRLLKVINKNTKKIWMKKGVI